MLAAFDIIKYPKAIGNIKHLFLGDRQNIGRITQEIKRSTFRLQFIPRFRDFLLGPADLLWRDVTS